MCCISRLRPPCFQADLPHFSQSWAIIYRWASGHTPAGAQPGSGRCSEFQGKLFSSRPLLGSLGSGAEIGTGTLQTRPLGAHCSVGTKQQLQPEGIQEGPRFYRAAVSHLPFPPVLWGGRDGTGQSSPKCPLSTIYFPYPRNVQNSPY